MMVKKSEKKVDEKLDALLHRQFKQLKYGYNPRKNSAYLRKGKPFDILSQVTIKPKHKVEKEKANFKVQLPSSRHNKMFPIDVKIPTYHLSTDQLSSA